MPFTIVRGDITKMNVDAIVNAANTGLAMGGGVCSTIFKAAGALDLQSACNSLSPIKTGEAVITPGFALPSRFIIHTAGPEYLQWSQEQSEAFLRAAYTNSLTLAAKNNCESIAFPLISSGTYGYPKDEALRVATSAIRDFISKNEISVFLVVFDMDSFTAEKSLLGEVANYIGKHYTEEHTAARSKLPYAEIAVLAEKQSADYARPMLQKLQCPKKNTTTETKSLGDIVGRLDEPFAATLLRLIDKSGKSDSYIYKRANIDRRLFSKIRSNLQYMPSKPTVLAFAVALELNLDQTKDLLERAGFALSHSRKFDVIVEYFITNKKHDIFEINEVLFSYDQALLGG